MSSETDEANGTSVEQVSEPHLAVENLAVSYGVAKALRGIDVTIERGGIVSVIGPNGAGKSTLANTVSGFLPYDGSIRHRGTEVREATTSELVADGLIQCTEDRDLFGYMDVEDNLRLGAYKRGRDIESQLEFVYDLFPRLEERSAQNARTMSGGEQQMLAIGRALMGEPDLLVLDEPTIGLAPVIIEDISEAIEEINDAGVSLLILEQNVTFGIKHADHLYLLENGKIELDGTPEDVKSDEYIREAYLGT